jgi:squalene-associated FAD-dependent desaturase
MNTEPEVVVVGAGCAGLAAAVRLARSGRRVLVLEARSRLGGRATAFTDSVTGERVDNGQHVLLGCYSATFEFLREIDALDAVRLQAQLSVSMVDPGGRRSRLVCPALPSPWHLVAGVVDWPALNWTDRASVLRLAAPLKIAILEARREREEHNRGVGSRGDGAVHGRRSIAASPGETVENWLLRHGQTERVREMLWRPLALAALNQPADRAAAPVFARVLAEMFGAEARAAAIALPSKPLDEMYAEPARAFIARHGGEVRTGAAAKIQSSTDGVQVVEVRGEQWQPRAVISAVPWFALAELFDAVPPSLAEVVERARRMEASPIVTVNLWFDRPVFDEPFVGMPGRTMQWAFDKGSIWGRGDSHVSMVSSGAESILGMSNDEVIAIGHAELLDALPVVRSARLLRSTVIREPRATFSLAPGQPSRPQTTTGVPGFYLAGDWIGTGLPATIESAVRSGHWAADATLAHLDGAP